MWSQISDRVASLGIKSCKDFFVKSYQKYELGKIIWRILRPKQATLAKNLIPHFLPCVILGHGHKTLRGLETCLNFV